MKLIRIAQLLIPTATLALAYGCGSADTAEAPKEPVVIEPASNSANLVQAKSVVAAAHASDLELKLLVRVFTDDGNAVEFYEPAPGYLITSGIELGGGMTMRERVPGYQKMTAPDVFSAVAPNHPVPDVLIQAQARSDARIQAEGEVETDAKAISSGGSTKAVDLSSSEVQRFSCPSTPNWCDMARFQCAECNNKPIDMTYKWCYQDAGDGAWADNSSSGDGGYGSICTVYGTPTFKISSKTFSGSWPVPPQTGRWAQAQSGTCGLEYCDQHIKYSVSGPGTDFQFGGQFWDIDIF